MSTLDVVTGEDAKRFRMAVLKAKLTRLGVAFPRDADEATLECLLRLEEIKREHRDTRGNRNRRGNRE